LAEWAARGGTAITDAGIITETINSFNSSSNLLLSYIGNKQKFKDNPEGAPVEEEPPFKILALPIHFLSLCMSAPDLPITLFLYMRSFWYL